MEANDYVIEIYGSAPIPTYLGLASDEDDQSILPSTTDTDLAVRFGKMQDANKECKRTVKRFPDRSFRVNVLPKQ